MATQKLKIGILGAAGYTGGELLRLLVFHPNVEEIYAQSRSQAGKPIASIHKDLSFLVDKLFVENIADKIDVIFLCLPHGESNKYLNNNNLDANIKIIDLSNDFRLSQNNNGFVYGLPELNKQYITQSNKIANPGCFATAIQLSLLPLANNNWIENDIHISAITGSTGAGNSLTPTSHFTWRNNNISTYKVFQHQHLDEIKQSVCQLQTNFDKSIYFVPYRGNFPRGIIASMYTKTDKSEEEIFEAFQNYYASHPFVIITKQEIDLKQVINTNFNYLNIKKIGDSIFIESVIDNLIKGASGQAVQNMNLIFGFDETLGLKLKPVAY